MNPILLKPTTDVGAQVIVLGNALRTMDAQEYQAFKPTLQATVAQALDRLRAQADIVVIEGAGSPAEINLKDGDLVNMWIAKYAQAKVLLVGNIDWGGVFAQLVGTMELLDRDERALVGGFLINKFRGDKILLEPGIRWLEDRYGLPVVGTIPYFDNVELLEEDSIARPPRETGASRGPLRIEVLELPRLSNFTDFDPLQREPDVQLAYIDRPSSEPLPDCVIIPGSKSTMADLAFLRQRGLDRYVTRCAEAGREVVGICGGFQMLGQQIQDPGHVEAATDAAPGLDLLPVVTVFGDRKLTAQVRGVHLESRLPVTGYEIHLGRMRGVPDVRPVFRLAGSHADDERDDGAQSPDGRIWGTHLHGLFDSDAFRRWWLNRLRQRQGLPGLPPTPADSADGVYDRLAQHVRPHLKMPAIYKLLELDAR